MAREIRFGVRISGDAREVRQSLRNTQQDVRRYRREMRSTQTQARGVTTATNTWAASLRQLRSIIGPLAGVGGVSMLARMTQNTISSTAALQDQADVAGLGVETFQEYTKAFQDLGNVSDSVTEGALRRFNRRFGQARQGTGQAKDTLEDLGVTLSQDTGPALEQAIRALAGIESESDRSAAAANLFGETAGPQLAAALNQGADALTRTIERLHETNRIMSQDSVDAATELDKRWRQLTDSMQTFGRQTVLETIENVRELNREMDLLGTLGGAAGPTGLAARIGMEGFARGQRSEMEELQDSIGSVEMRIERLTDRQEGSILPRNFDREIEQLEQRLDGLLARRRQLIMGDIGIGQVDVVPGLPEFQSRGFSDGLGDPVDFDGGRDAAHVDLRDDQDRERQRRENELLREREQLLRQIRTPQEEYGEQISRLQRLHQEGLISQEQFNRGVEHAEQALGEATRASNEHMRSLQMTFSSHLEDSIMDFDNWRDSAVAALTDVQRIMLRMMVTEPLVGSVAGLFSGLGGGGGGFQGVGAATPRTFAGGGYTGDGSRSGGLDGQGGFMAMLHPRETVIDHTRGGGGDTIVVNQSYDFRNADESAARNLRREADRIKQDTIRTIQDRQQRRGRSRV